MIELYRWRTVQWLLGIGMVERGKGGCIYKGVVGGDLCEIVLCLDCVVGYMSHI